MAASTTPDTRGLLTAGRYRLLRELGSRALATYAALHEKDGNAHLFIVERLARGGKVSDEDAADYIRDARRIAELEHPNIVRVREVGIRPDEVLVACDYMEGEPLGSMLGVVSDGVAMKAPLEVVLRVLVDVLTGLGALHNLRDVKRQPLKLVHGELSPANVIVGVDGTARIVQVCRVAALATRPGRAGSGYLAPEVLLADGSVDPRADVYSVGVLLWEALCGRRMLSEAAPHAIVAHILSGRVARAVAPPDAPWATDLVAVAHRALSADPAARFANAAAMAAELRRVAGSRLATTGRASTFVKQAYGAKIAARRQALVTHEGSVVTTSPASVPRPPSFDSDVDEATQNRAITSPPPPVEDGFDVNLDADPDDPQRATSPPFEPSPPPPVAPPAVAHPPVAPPHVAPPPVVPPPVAPVRARAMTVPGIAPPAVPAPAAPPPPATRIEAPRPAPATDPSPSAPSAIARPHAPIFVAPPPAPPPPPTPASPFVRAPSPEQSAPPALFPLTEDDEPALAPPPPVGRRWIIIFALAAAVAVLLSWGSWRILSRGDSSRDVAMPAVSAGAPTGASSAASVAPSPPPPTTIAPTDTGVADPSIPTATPSALPIPTDPIGSASSPSSAPTTTATPPADTPGPHPPAWFPGYVGPGAPGYVPPKPGAKPRPTYDPQGI